MPGEIVCSNAYVQERTENIRSFLDAGHVLRLFQNDFDPEPADTIAAFVQSTFPGYSTRSLTGTLGDVFKVEDGIYQFTSQSFQWCPTGPSIETCYGWYITAGSTLKMSCRLPEPKVMTVGDCLTVYIDFISWAAILLSLSP